MGGRAGHCLLQRAKVPWALDPRLLQEMLVFGGLSSQEDLQDVAVWAPPPSFLAAAGQPAPASA